ncbi:hypothetical protein SFRURICE_006464 [Spodoptera frugiperda]|nr:hypothetical protein SFRURICE_006464 [Spodoptera frugiperda]
MDKSSLCGVRPSNHNGTRIQAQGVLIGWGKVIMDDEAQLLSGAACPARPSEINDCLGSRNETNQKMLLEEKKKITIVSTSFCEFNAGDRIT